MKVISVLAALAGITLATPLERRIIAQEFDVSSFQAGCLPHGSTCTVSFSVATNQMPYATQCQVTANAANSLPDVPFTACADPTVVFSFRGVGLPGSLSNYTLLLADASQSLAAAQLWDAALFPRINDGSSFHQTYTGPASFVVKN